MAKKEFKREFWNVWLVVRSIQELRISGVPLNYGSLEKNRSKKCASVLARVPGRKTNGLGLIRAHNRFFKTWDKALRTAGVRPCSTRKMGERIQWNRDHDSRCISHPVYYCGDISVKISSKRRCYTFGQ